jgi:hypothetical protein
MDHICGLVQESHFATFENLSGFAHANQVGLLDKGEGNAKGIDPEGIRFDGILEKRIVLAMPYTKETSALKHGARRLDNGVLEL